MKDFDHWVTNTAGDASKPAKPRDRRADKWFCGSDPEALELVKAFGLEGKLVTSINFSLSVDSVAHVTVGFEMSTAEAKAVCEIVKKFNLVLKEDK